LVLFGGRVSLPNEVYNYTNETYLMRDIAKFARRDPNMPSPFDGLRFNVSKLKDYAMSVKAVEPAFNNLVQRTAASGSESLAVNDFKWNGKTSGIAVNTKLAEGCEAKSSNSSTGFFFFKKQYQSNLYCIVEDTDLIYLLVDRHFGEVSKGVHGESNTEVAIRIVPNQTKSVEDAAKMLKECDFLKRIKNRNLAACYGFAQGEKDPTTFWILTEFCDGGSVKDVMNVLSKPLSEKQVGYICSQVLLGLSYLHQLNIVHRQIKASNVMFTPDGQVKLSRPLP